ncbi:MAG: hypothetical protein RAO75_07550 [Candidatus Chlorobium antarcticum]|jgi:hypothetical protein|nr:hypothetical protein [Candidatus Chlorobium antarcticum]
MADCRHYAEGVRLIDDGFDFARFAAGSVDLDPVLRPDAEGFDFVLVFVLLFLDYFQVGGFNSSGCVPFDGPVVDAQLLFLTL